MTKEKIICSKCGKLKQNHGNGICNWCYRKYFWKQKLIICKRCGKERFHQAKGYCSGCYSSVFYLESNKDHNYRKWHNISPELYKKITKKCLIFGFDKVVDLHNLDESHDNNSEKNMIGLCPNHHKMLHNFKYREEVLTQIQEALADDKSLLPSEETLQEDCLNTVQTPLAIQTEALASPPLTIPIQSNRTRGLIKFPLVQNIHPSNL